MVWVRWWLLLVAVLSASPHAAGKYVEEHPEHFTHDFVVQIDGDDMVADLVARSYGFRKIEKVSGQKVR